MSCDFPLGSLVPCVREFVIETSNSLPCSPEMLALPSLATIGTAIGNSRRIRITETWTEPCSMYGAIVAETGSMKSPALKLATEPLKKLQTEARRTWTSNITVERLAELQAEHPRGLLMYQDELTAWVGSMNQYKKGGDDKEFFLTGWNGDSFVVDRKQTTTDNKRLSIVVPRLFISVIGCIPPSLLPSLTLGSGLEDGFLPRILFVQPKPVPIRLMKNAVQGGVLAGYEKLIGTLSELDSHISDPVLLEMTPDAWAAFEVWHNDHCKQMESRTLVRGLKGFYSKHRGYCARLALCHAVALEPDTTEVTLESVEAAIAQIEYFKHQAAGIVRQLDVGVGTVGTRSYRVWSCREAIVRHVRGGKMRNRRAVQRQLNHERDIFNDAWDSLVNPLRMVEKRGVPLTLETWGASKEDRSVVEGGTDIPTTDIEGDTAA